MISHKNTKCETLNDVLPRILLVFTVFTGKINHLSFLFRSQERVRQGNWQRPPVKCQNITIELLC